MLSPPRTATLAVAVAGLLAGCGGSTPTPQSMAERQALVLREVGEMYRLCVLSAKNHTPPARLKDLQAAQAVAPIGFDAVRHGTIIVRWGARLTDTSEEGGQDPADQVLAFEASVPESGGQVLMLNRAVHTMTPEQFKAARLAGTSSSSAEGTRSPKR